MKKRKNMTSPKNAFRGGSLNKIVPEQGFISMTNFITELPVKIGF
jgi:hypothetical protein